MLAILRLVLTTAYAQNGGPIPVGTRFTAIPLDEGAYMLLLTGAAYGQRQLHDMQCLGLTSVQLLEKTNLGHTSL